MLDEAMNWSTSSKPSSLHDSVFDQAAVGLSQLTPDGHFVKVNAELCRMLGRSSEQLLASNIADVTHPDDLPHSQEALRQLLETGHRASLDKRYVQPDGTIIHANSALTRLKDNAGHSIGILAVTADLTHRKKAEAELSQLSQEADRQRRLYETILSNTPDLVYVFDLNHRFTFVNDALLKMWGRTAEQSIGKRLAELDYPSWHAQMHERELEQVAETKQPLRGEVPFKHAVLGQRVYEYIFVPVINDAGEVEAIAGTTRDVTDRKNAEAAIERDLADMQRLHTLATRLLGTMDLEAVLQEILEAAVAIADCHRGTVQLIDPLTGKFDLVAKLGFDETAVETISAFASATAETVAEALQHGQAMNATDLESSSQFDPDIVRMLINIDVRAIEFTPLRTRLGELIGVISTYFNRPQQTSLRTQRFVDLLARQAADVIDRVRFERALVESEQQFRELADSMPQLVWTATADGKVDYYNSQISEYAGIAQRSNRTWEWDPVVHPDDIQATRGAWQQAVNTGSLYEVQHRIQMADGTARWHLSRARPMIVQGKVVKWFGAATDIHDTKAAQEELAQHRHNLEQLVQQRTIELEQSHKRLRMSERMASIGTLSAGLGHDMGNLLLPVNVRLAALKEGGLTDEQAKHIEVIETSTRYLQELSKGLRLLSNDPADARAKGNISLNKWWATTSRILKNVLPGHINLEHHFPKVDTRAAINRAALTQAVFNLVQNAGDAMRERVSGTVRVWVDNDSDTEKVVIGVSDDGPGMTDDVKRRCMEAYYSTKSRGLSTGMGLALVRGLLAEVGGRVEIESSPGHGTTFKLLLPKAAARKSRSKRTRRAVVLMRDARMRAIIERELQSLNFRLVRADQKQALSVVVVDSQTLREFSRARHTKDAQVVIVGESEPQDTTGIANAAHLGSAQKITELRGKLRELIEPG